MADVRSFTSAFDTAGSGEDVLRVEHLRTYFFTRDGVVPAVDDVSFRIRRGEILGLVGESGSGKSVTARSVMRLVPVPGRTVAGEIWFAGLNLLDVSEADMRHIRGARIGMVLQEPMTSLNPVLTIGTQVIEMFSYHPERAGEGSHSDQAANILGRVKIPDSQRRMGEYPMHFSGGMRQRVSIAMATACNPDLVIADEPTTALDVTTQAQVLDLLLELRRELGVGVLFITHDLGVVAEICDSVAVMYAGKIVEYNDVESIFERPQHPYTQALLNSLPRLGERVDKLPTIEGQPPDIGDLPAGCAFSPRCPAAIDRCRVDAPKLANFGDHGQVSCWVAADRLEDEGQLRPSGE